MFGQEPKCDHVVGLPAAHRLIEKERPLLGLPGEAIKRLPEQGLHSICDVVRLEEPSGIDSVLDEICKVKDCVPAARVEDFVPNLAEVLE